MGFGRLFVMFVIVYVAHACDEEACHIGTSVVSGGCAAASAIGAGVCAATAVATLGLGCILGLGGSTACSVISGGLGAGLCPTCSVNNQTDFVNFSNEVSNIAVGEEVETILAQNDQLRLDVEELIALIMGLMEIRKKYSQITNNCTINGKILRN